MLTPENMERAFKNLIKGKSKYESVRRMLRRKEMFIANVRQELLDKTYKHGGYQSKLIYEPKERRIYVANLKDRYVHHLLLLVTIPYLEARMDYWSLACRKGKGLHKGSQFVMERMRKYKYFLKLDVRKFYPSIDHGVLKEQLKHIFKDPDILWLFDNIINSCPGGKNAPIGNYTSQWFGNWYLTQLDRFVRETLKVKAYVRYCDDAVIFGNSKRELAQQLEQIEQFLRSKLKLSLSKKRIAPTTCPIDFLGYLHYRTYVIVRKRTAKRLIKRMQEVYNAKPRALNKAYIQSMVGSYIGVLKYAKTYNLRMFTHLDEICKRFDMKKFNELNRRTNKDEYKTKAEKITLDALENKTVEVLDYVIKASKFSNADGIKPDCAHIYLKLDGQYKVVFTSSKAIVDDLKSIIDKEPFVVTVGKVGNSFVFKE